MIAKLFRFKNTVTSKLQWLPFIAARVTIGEVFITSGWGKLHDLPKIIAYFTQLGIPAPQIQAPFAASMEFACGCLVLPGLVTEFAAIPLIVIMLVALVTARKPDIGSFDDLTSMIEYLYIMILLWLAIYGAGPVSIDRVLRKRYKKS